MVCRDLAARVLHAGQVDSASGQAFAFVMYKPDIAAAVESILTAGRLQAAGEDTRKFGSYAERQRALREKRTPKGTSE
jgi:hypothetical protein